MLKQLFSHKWLLANKKPLVAAILKINHPCFPTNLCSKRAGLLYRHQFIRKHYPPLPNKSVSTNQNTIVILSVRLARAKYRQQYIPILRCPLLKKFSTEIYSQINSNYLEKKILNLNTQQISEVAIKE